MKQLTKQQKEALKLLKGLSKEEIIEYLDHSDLPQVGDKYLDKLHQALTVVVVEVTNGYVRYKYNEQSEVSLSHPIDEFLSMMEFAGKRKWRENHLKYDYFYKEKEKEELALRHKYLHMKIVNRVRELNDGATFNIEIIDVHNIYEVHYLACLKKIGWSSIGTNFGPAISGGLDFWLKSAELAIQLEHEMYDELLEYFTYQNYGWLK